MSVYELKAGADWPSGLFDARQEIIVSPSSRIPPHVVVEHEIAHISIHNTSFFGLIERVFRALDALALNARSLTALRRLDEAHKKLAAGNVIHVHEVAAWYSTELLIEQLPDYSDLELSPPPQFKQDVGLVRFALRNVEKVLYRSPMIVAEIVESAAALALSPPGLAALLDSADTPEDLASYDWTEMGGPVSQFKLFVYKASQLTDRELAGFQNHDEPEDWRPSSRLRPGISADLLGRLAASLNLPIMAYGGALDPATFYKFYQSNLALDTNISRYAQVSVFEAQRCERKAEFFERWHQALANKTYASYVGVSAGHPYAIGHSVMTPGLVALHVWDLASRQSQLLPTLPDTHLRAFLESPENLVLTKLHGYDLRNADCNVADLGGVDHVLRGIPHVIVATTSFRIVWHALTVKGGIAGERSLEVLVAPADGLGKDYIHLLIRAINSEGPLLFMSAVAARWSELLTHARTWSLTPFPRLHLNAVSVKLEDFAGKLTPHVIAAIALKESWWSFEGEELSSWSDTGSNTLPGWS